MNPPFANDILHRLQLPGRRFESRTDIVLQTVYKACVEFGMVVRQPPGNGIDVELIAQAESMVDGIPQLLHRWCARLVWPQLKSVQAETLDFDEMAYDHYCRVEGDAVHLPESLTARLANLSPLYIDRPPSLSFVAR